MNQLDLKLWESLLCQMQETVNARSLCCTLLQYVPLLPEINEQVRVLENHHNLGLGELRDSLIEILSGYFGDDWVEPTFRGTGDDLISSIGSAFGWQAHYKYNLDIDFNEETVFIYLSLITEEGRRDLSEDVPYPAFLETFIRYYGMFKLLCLMAVD